MWIVALNVIRYMYQTSESSMHYKQSVSLYMLGKTLFILILKALHRFFFYFCNIFAFLKVLECRLFLKTTIDKSIDCVLNLRIGFFR